MALLALSIAGCAAAKDTSQDLVSSARAQVSPDTAAWALGCVAADAAIRANSGRRQAQITAITQAAALPGVSQQVKTWAGYATTLLGYTDPHQAPAALRNQVGAPWTAHGHTITSLS